MARPIEDQVIVITGASSGIGLVTARRAAEGGARVVLAARNTDDIERAADDIRANGGRAIAVATDVSEATQVEELARRTIDAFGRIDTWVNNAGIIVYAPFEETSLEDFRRIMDVNFMGQVHGARAALPHLRASHGALVCVGSVESDRGMPFHSAYSASKHAIKGWLDALRTELEKDGAGVRVTLVKPTFINTPLFDHAKTQIGVKPQGMPPAYEPELAADAILHAAQHDVRDIYVGTPAKVMSLTERFQPRLNDVQNRMIGFKSQRTKEPKAADAPHNLYQPLPHDGGERGTFQAISKRRSLYPWVTEHRVRATTIAVGALLGATIMLAHGKSPRRDGTRRRARDNPFSIA